MKTALIIGAAAIGIFFVWQAAQPPPAPVPAPGPVADPGLGILGALPYATTLSALNKPLQGYVINPINQALSDAGVGMTTPKGSLTPTSSANAVLADAICQCYHGYGTTYNGSSACVAANATVPGGGFKKGDADCHPTFPDGDHITLTNAARKGAGLAPITMPIAWNAPGGIKNAAAGVRGIV